MIKVDEVIKRMHGINAVAIDKNQLCINNMSMNELNKLIRDAVTVMTVLEMPLPEQDKADLDVIHRIRRGSIKKCVRYEYAIYNGAWFREHPWQIPKEHEPHILAPDEFGACGTGWIEHWCSIEDDRGENRSELFFERCAWCGKTLATDEFVLDLVPGDMMIEYGKVGGFRVWGGDYAPSAEKRKGALWHV